MRRTYFMISKYRAGNDSYCQSTPWQAHSFSRESKRLEVFMIVGYLPDFGSRWAKTYLGEKKNCQNKKKISENLRWGIRITVMLFLLETNVPTTRYVYFGAGEKLKIFGRTDYTCNYVAYELNGSLCCFIVSCSRLGVTHLVCVSSFSNRDFAYAAY